jgi:3-deoxy-D-manno-octulosonic-acid transferase
MGEMNSITGLVRSWRDRCPDVDFVISATTDTGIDRARRLFPDLTVIRYPLDFSWSVRRAMDRIKPAMVVLVELEVWYQFLAEAERRHIPVAVINGRITAEKSLSRFRWIMPVIRPMFRRLSWVGTIDGTYASRFEQVGVPAERIDVMGSMKWDAAEVADRIAGDETLAEALGIDISRPLWVCGSTGPGEEALICRAYQRLLDAGSDLQLAVIPRKPERFDEVARTIESMGFACVRRSEHPDDAKMSSEMAATDKSVVVLGDTMGELRKFYSLATVVFVGRSLVPMGGSDMMEPAGLARPVIVGPHTENFADIVRRFQEAQAMCILDVDADDPAAAQQLADAVGHMLEHDADRAAQGQRAREVVLNNRGSTEQTLDHLMELLTSAEHDAS